MRSVPIKVASHMLYTGLPITAREACEAGLVSKVVPNDKLGNNNDESSRLFLFNRTSIIDTRVNNCFC